MRTDPKSLQSQPTPTVLCMDARALAMQSGTGVSSYAHQLRLAQCKIAQSSMLLTDRRLLDVSASSALGRPLRWLRALWPGARRAKAITVSRHRDRLYASDVFRIAQIFFDVHRRPLPVRLPGPPGIMHWTYPIPLEAVGWRNLYTVHDVIPLLHPQLTDIDGRRYRRLLKQLQRGAAGFIAVSQTARQEIIDTLRCPSSFVQDCGIAIDQITAESACLPPEIGPGPYLLVCGTVERRKNIDAILAAYRASGLATPIVLAGPDGFQANQFAADIANSPGVIRLPYLSRAAMLALITHARALVMPSLAEGFGMPVAEAMALGVPVVTSSVGALAETAGQAALLVDPYDVQAIAQALKRVATDAALHLTLSRAGQENARRFTPERFVERLTEAYASVMTKPL